MLDDRGEGDRMATIGKPINRAFITDEESFTVMLKSCKKENAIKRKKMAQEFAKNNVDKRDNAQR